MFKKLGKPLNFKMYEKDGCKELMSTETSCGQGSLCQPLTAWSQAVQGRQIQRMSDWRFPHKPVTTSGGYLYRNLPPHRDTGRKLVLFWC